MTIVVKDDYALECKQVRGKLMTEEVKHIPGPITFKLYRNPNDTEESSKVTCVTYNATLFC